MRFLPNSWFYGLVLTGLTLVIASPVYADDPCGGAKETLVNHVKDLLQDMLTKAPGPGKFKVSVNMDENGAPFQHNITFEVNNKTINIKRTLLGESAEFEYFEITPVAQDKALYFKILSGGSNPETNCSYVFVPQAGTIKKIWLQNDRNLIAMAYTEDLDKDGDPEIITGSLPNWLDSCDGRVSGAGTPYWFRIMHVDLSTGQLRDDSAQYPDFYANQAKKLKDSLNGLQNLPAEVTGGQSGPLSPACTKGFEDLISRAEKAGAGQSANSIPAITQGDDKKLSEEIERQFDSKVVKCGDSWFAAGGLQSFNGSGLLELKEPTLHISSDKLSNSDVANGVQFRGQLDVKVKFYREYRHDENKWEAWREATNEAIGGLPLFAGGGYGGFLHQIQSPGVFGVVVQNGQYSWDSSFTNAKKPAFDCSQLPIVKIGDSTPQAAELLDNLGVTDCGSTKLQRLFLQLAEAADATVAGFSFNEACKAHDACYGDCLNRPLQRECDDQLLKDARSACESTHALGRDSCIATAGKFFDFVTNKGEQFYNQAQKNCPTTQLPVLPVIDNYSVDVTTGKWKLKKATAIYPTADDSAKPLRQLKEGELLNAVALRFSTTSYAVAQIAKSKNIHFWRLIEGFPQQDFNVAMAAGDQVAILRYFGEGECIVWYKGETYISACPGDDETFSGDKITGSVERDKTDIWAKVTTKDGSEGWVKNPDTLCMSKYDTDPFCNN